MKINKKEIRYVIKYNEGFLSESKNKEEHTESGEVTIYGHTAKNIEEYNCMLEYTDTEQMSERLRELYKSISILMPYYLRDNASYILPMLFELSKKSI